MRYRFLPLWWQSTNFEPSSISGLRMWLDASDAASVAISSGTKVAAWNDKSGSARHVVQATTASQPDFLTVGGRNLIRFDGSDDFLRFDGGIGTLNASVYVACRIMSNDSTSDSPITFGSIVNDPFRYYSMGNGFSAGGAGGFWGFRSPGQDSQTATPKTVGDTILTFTVERSGTTVTPTLYVDNVLDSQRAVTFGTAPFYNTGEISIGRSVSTGTAWEYSSVYVYEVLIYDGVHDATTRSIINSYLAAKWRRSYNPPAGVSSGLALWIDASDAATVTVDASNNIAAVLDKGSGARHSSQPATLRRAAYAPGRIGELPAISFDGTDDGLRVPSITLSSSITLFAVYQPDIPGAKYFLFEHSPDVNSNNGMFVYGAPPFSRTKRTPNDNSHGPTGAPLSGTSVGLLTYLSDTTLSATGEIARFWFNGDPLAMGTASGSGTTVANTNVSSSFNIGARNGGDAVHYDGALGELLVYDRPLATGEREAVQDYLRAKWQIIGPANISQGLALWIDASDTSRIAVDGSNNVIQWNDRSVNGRHMTAPALAVRPALVANVLGGRSVVRFDGVDDYIETAADVAAAWYGSGTQSTTWVYLVAYREHTTGKRWSLALQAAQGVSQNRMILDRQPPVDGTMDFTIWPSGGSTNVVDAPNLSPLTSWAIETVRWTQGGTPTLRRTKPLATATFSGAASLALAMTGSMRAMIGGSIVPAAADVAEWMIYNRSLSDAEVAELESYLVNKWGL